jgi:hypothetical protein
MGGLSGQAAHWCRRDPAANCDTVKQFGATPSYRLIPASEKSETFIDLALANLRAAPEGVAMDKLFSNEGRAATQSRRYALQYVQDLDIPRLFEPPADDFSCLGPKISVLAAGTVSRLREIHGANLPYLMGIAVRESWFACSAGSWHSTLTGDPEGAEQTGQAEKLGTPEGYAQLKGWATTLMASLFRPNRDSDGAQFLYDTPYFELPDDFDILCCMALCWLGHAADAQKAGSTVEAFDWISEAHEALENAHGLKMWDAGAEAERTDGQGSDLAEKAARSKFARTAAMARHAENHSLKAEVFAWCDANAADYKSMDAAAWDIAGKIAPVVFRTARDWVGEWKKLRSAGTP